MSVINVFRNYIEEKHPELVLKDWKIDERALSVDNIRNEVLKSVIEWIVNEEIKCWVFYYDEGPSNVVYLLQDKKGMKNIGIGLLKDGELVKPISFV